jgi:hypothetical protein
MAWILRWLNQGFRKEFLLIHTSFFFQLFLLRTFIQGLLTSCAMRKKRLIVIYLVGLCCLQCAVSCKNDDASPDRCMADVQESENSFTWQGNTYSVSGSPSDLVICSENEVDAFYSANTTHEITFGFDKVKGDLNVTLDNNGNPSSTILLKDRNVTYVAVAGMVVSCQGGYQFSLGFRRLTNSADPRSVTGSVMTLTGLIKCQ